MAMTPQSAKQLLWIKKCALVLGVILLAGILFGVLDRTLNLPELHKIYLEKGTTVIGFLDPTIEADNNIYTVVKNSNKVSA